MAKLKRVLSCVGLPPRSRNEDGIYLNLAETLQFGHRNVRLSMSETEWAATRGAVQSLGITCEKESERLGYRMGNPTFLVALNYNEKLRPDSYIFRDRFAVEEQDDGTIHFHYRDLRVRITPDEFKGMAEAMWIAYQTYQDKVQFPADGTKRETKMVPIRSITPFNCFHPVGMEDSADTMKAIEYAKSLLAEGKKLRPVLVDENGALFDGYARCVAQLMAGKEEIEVIIDPFAQVNGQVGQSMEASDERE